MITIDTWTVIKVKDDNVIVECHFNNIKMNVSSEGPGNCDAGNNLSPETGGRLYLKEELN